MKNYRWLLVLSLCFLILGCAKARTYSLYLRYQPGKDLSSLKPKIGSTLGIAPFKDERQDPSYVGILIPFQGVSSYFKSDPSPLEKAITDSLVEVLSAHSVKAVSVSPWDKEPPSLRNFETDSVLMIEIKKFWIEGKDVAFRTNLRISIHFVIHLGVKKEGRVFTKNVTIEKEMGVFRLSLEQLEQTVNGLLTEILDGFFSDPYQTILKGSRKSPVTAIVKR